MRSPIKRCLTLVVVGGWLATIARASDLPVKTVEHSAPSVGRTLKFNIVLPARYEQSDARYPVLYLLHGFSGNYTQWARYGAPGAAASHELIVVMPDGGNSWWINWANNEAGQKNDWENYLVKDLVPYVDANFRTIATRAGRAIGGLSMGGYGAMTVGLRHPELFCSISSNSGALNYARNMAQRVTKGESLRPEQPPATEINPLIGVAGFSSQAERTPNGDPFVAIEDCDNYDPYQLVLKVPRDQLPHISLDCGSEDTWLPNTREFFQVLLEHRIPCVFAQSPGEHSGNYWRREIGLAMALQYEVIERSLAATSAATAASTVPK